MTSVLVATVRSYSQEASDSTQSHLQYREILSDVRFSSGWSPAGYFAYLGAIHEEHQWAVKNDSFAMVLQALARRRVDPVVD
mmetsp:Transcript_10990/g.28942  ORF Transcript_10990/g.28942 Transcript_10990/m.28942 type:complete len:82 (+) Transcript_10990:470-715(+)